MLPNLFRSIASTHVFEVLVHYLKEGKVSSRSSPSLVTMVTDFLSRMTELILLYLVHQVLAQIDLFNNKHKIQVTTLSKKLDEKVAQLHMKHFDAKLTLSNPEEVMLFASRSLDVVPSAKEIVYGS